MHLSPFGRLVLSRTASGERRHHLSKFVSQLAQAIISQRIFDNYTHVGAP